MCIFISIYQELFNKEDSIINPILQMRKLRHRAVIYPRSKLPNAMFHHFCHRRPHHRHLCSCMCCLRAVAEAALRTNPKSLGHSSVSLYCTVHGKTGHAWRHQYFQNIG